ncbi:MAG: sulfite reductase (NADPH) hemoprotein beta-component, partial [Gammaproteobacteria bacterium]
GLRIVKDDETGTYFDVYVGGGMGRTPIIAKLIKASLPGEELLHNLQAIIRVYNQYGRRDHKYRSRIKILVNDLGVEEFTKRVDEELQNSLANAPKLDTEKLAGLKKVFAFRRPAPEQNIGAVELPITDPVYASWLKHNTVEHQNQNERIVMVSLKSKGVAPGDITSGQMHHLANLAEEYSLSEIRATHGQNLVLPHVQEKDLYTLWRGLDEQQLATPNIGTLTDMIACPGFDFCSLANTTTLDIADQITQHFSDLSKLHDLGEVTLKISGCMNSCAHHHAGNIGVLGVDKKGEQWYQLTLGGRSDNQTTVGKRIGPAIAKAKLTDAISTIVDVYLAQRQVGEHFIQCVERIGIEPFKEQIYATH